MHARLGSESTDHRIRDYLLRTRGSLDKFLYLQLRLYQAMIRRWAGEMVLVSFDVKAESSSLGRPFKGFLCGILSETTLVLDEKHGVFFPTGYKHMSEKSPKKGSEEGDVCLEPANILALPTLVLAHPPQDVIVPGVVYGQKSDPNAPELILGNQNVQAWFKEKRGSDTLYHQCQHSLSKRHVPFRRASVRALA